MDITILNPKTNKLEVVDVAASNLNQISEELGRMFTTRADVDFYAPPLSLKALMYRLNPYADFIHGAQVRRFRSSLWITVTCANHDGDEWENSFSIEETQTY